MVRVAYIPDSYLIKRKTILCLQLPYVPNTRNNNLFGFKVLLKQKSVRIYLSWCSFFLFSVLKCVTLLLADRT